MAVTGLRKAALLLMSLDAATASELLKGMSPDIVTSLAVELAYLDATGVKAKEYSSEVIREFCGSLKRPAGFALHNFLGKMLESSVGAKKAQEIQSQIGELLKRRDPFLNIRKADTQKLILALQDEHPQAVAMVLSELTPKQSSEILSQLNEELRIKTVKRLTHPEFVSQETKVKIANVILLKIEARPGIGSEAAAAVTAVTPGQSRAALRKVSVLIRGLAKELRDGLVNAIKKSDEETGNLVCELMVTWEDLPMIADRQLQEGLRAIESQKLAKALLKADPNIVKKIRANISERARALLDEETSLISNPKKEEIEAAREELVSKLREMNEKGELTFAEE